MLRFISLLFLIASSAATAFSTEQGVKSFINVGDKIQSPTECYTIVEQLGEGAFGKVFAVEDSGGQLFALKSYKIQGNPDMENSLLADSEREFLRGQMLNHPHIIKSFDLFSCEEISTNLVLQLVKGKTLFATDRQTLMKEQALESALQFCQAMQYALSLDLFHLDLHVGNVMISEQTETMVIDLASFFTFAEIFNFVDNTEMIEEAEKIATAPAQTGYQKTMRTLVDGLHPMIPRQVNATAAGVHHEKIKRFFVQHPQLFAQMKQASRQTTYRKMNRTIVSAQKEATKNHHGSTQLSDENKNLFFSFYFNRVAEICIQIISKADLRRSDKLYMWGEIKKIVWNYNEDAEEGICAPVEQYFNELQHLLQTLH